MENFRNQTESQVLLTVVSTAVNMTVISNCLLTQQQCLHCKYFKIVTAVLIKVAAALLLIQGLLKAGREIN